MPMNVRALEALPLAALLLAAGCQQSQPANEAQPKAEAKRDASEYLSQPLVTDIYTADPAAHVWNGKIHVYPSHDIDGPTPEAALGRTFELRDYRILEMDRIGGPVRVGRSVERRGGQESVTTGQYWWSP